MNFMKEETALMFDVSKLKVGSIIMIHYSDSERYGMVDYVSPTNISIGREDGTSVSILSTDVYLDKENPVEGKVFLDVISPEEMYSIFDQREEKTTGSEKRITHEQLLDIEKKVMHDLANHGNKKAQKFLANPFPVLGWTQDFVYDHICKSAYFFDPEHRVLGSYHKTPHIHNNEDIEATLRKETEYWLNTNIEIKDSNFINKKLNLPEEDLSDAQHMYKIIEECANQGSKLSKMYLEIYDKQSAEECKKDDEMLAKMYFKSGKDHDKAKATWIASSFYALMQGLIDSNK